MGPPPPPPAPVPTPSTPFTTEELTGTWDTNDSGGHVHFTLVVDGTDVTFTNVDDSTSCWATGTGSIDLREGIITAVANSDKCTRRATGVVTRTTNTHYVDQDYRYLATTHFIHWVVDDASNGWPV